MKRKAKPLKSVRALRREVNRLKKDLQDMTNDRDHYQRYVVNEYRKQNACTQSQENVKDRITKLLAKVLPFPHWVEL